MNVLIIGAHGKIGKIVSEKLKDAEKFEPTAFIRKEEQRSYFEEKGIPTEVESLENGPEALEKVIAKYDAIVFTAGSGGKTGPDKTMEIDLDGAIKAINSAEKAGTKRFIMVSASHTDDRSFWGKVDGMKPYYIAKHYADLELKRSNLDWTILRPVQLTDDSEHGKVLFTDDPEKVNQEIPRVAVAETILQLLNNQKSYGKVIEMSSGEDELSNALDAIF